MQIDCIVFITTIGETNLFNEEISFQAILQYGQLYRSKYPMSFITKEKYRNKLNPGKDD
nr:MAG TPA: hypothetical protein [Caudoviricetes sp.]